MASLEQLSALGKLIMNAVVDVEMLGLLNVRPYLDRAFDEVVAEARSVRGKEVRAEAERVSGEGGAAVSES